MIMSLRQVLLQLVSVRRCAKDVEARPHNEGLGSFTLRYENCPCAWPPGAGSLRSAMGGFRLKQGTSGRFSCGSHATRPSGADPR
jgi:hypothetical protein